MPKRCVFPILLAVLLAGCRAGGEPITETQEAYRIEKGTLLTLVLDSPLSTRTSERGDPVVCRLKGTIKYKGSQILPSGTQVNGLVVRVDKFRKLGDRAALGLIFDQIVLSQDAVIPIAASLDTKQGSRVIKIPGQSMQKAKVMSHSTLAGLLIGESVIEGQGAQKGIAMGAGVGSSALFLSESKEITLPSGTEFTVRLDDSTWIPK